MQVTVACDDDEEAQMPATSGTTALLGPHHTGQVVQPSVVQPITHSPDPVLCRA